MILKIFLVDYTKKTKVLDDTKNPEWNEELVFPRANSDTVKVQVKIFHEESLGKDKYYFYLNIYTFILNLR